MSTESHTGPDADIARTDADIDGRAAGTRKHQLAVPAWSGAEFAPTIVLSLVLTGLYDAAVRDFGIGSVAACVLIGLAGFVAVWWCGRCQVRCRCERGRSALEVSGEATGWSRVCSTPSRLVIPTPDWPQRHLMLLAPLLIALTACQPSLESTRFDDVPDELVHPDGTINVRPDSSIIENGLPVRLHIVLKKPRGEGPFPVLVFNHGSAGNGKDPETFRRIHTPGALVHFFVNRGWMVALPQRRGRGWSDGLYGEGLNVNRRGYTCDASRTMTGVRRALVDIEAAMKLLKARPDVDSTRIVVGGQSRGGVLSIAYAGSDRDELRGAINFAGNWLDEECDTSSSVNKRITSMGSTFPERTLWLYGGQDEDQSLNETRRIFRNFMSHGGKGRLATYPDANHYLIAYPWIWKDALSSYMTSLGFSEFGGDH